MHMDTYEQSTRESLQRILNSIELAVGFHEYALYLVECSLATQQDEYIAALEEECSARGVSLIQIDLSSQIVPDLRQHIIDFLRERFSDAVPKKYRPGSHRIGRLDITRPR